MHAEGHARLALPRLPRATEHGNGVHVPGYIHECSRCLRSG